MFKKNIIITTSIYPPELHPSGIMNQELAERLIDFGYNVKISSGFPTYPYGKLHPGWQRSLLHKSILNGVEIFRSWHPIFSNKRFLARALSSFGKSLSYLVGVPLMGRPDVIISDGPDIIGPLISEILGKYYNAKLIVVIHDLVFDIIKSTKKINSTILSLLQRIEILSLRLSDKLIVLSEGFRRTLIHEKGIPPEKIIVIPVWLDKNEVYPLDRKNPWRREMGIPLNKFVVLYAGTIGLVSGAPIVVEAARLLQDHPDILFLFVGEGRVKDEVQILATQAGLSNIRFLPFQPRERLCELQASADVSLVTLAPGRGKTSVPSKVLGYMAAARPVIASVDQDCDTAETIRSAQCGLVVPPADPLTLAAAVLYYYRRPKALQEAGSAGYNYFLSNFEKEVILPQYLAVIQQIANS